jgi:hypothetical protein
MTQAELQTAMAAQHQAVDVSLQQMMGMGPQAAMAASQAQAVLAGAQAQIQQLAAQGPGSLTPEQAVGIQMAAMQQAAGLVAQTGGPGQAPTQLLTSLMAQTGQALALQQEAAAAPAVVDPTVVDPTDPAGPGDDFDDDIMAQHLPQPGAAAGDERSEVRQRLDPDGDGQINSGIAAPRVTAVDDADDPFADAQWQDNQGDALMGDPAPMGAPEPADAPAWQDDTPDTPDTGWQDDTPDAPEPEPMAAAPEPAAMPDPEPIAPVEVPDDIPDAPPVDEVPDDVPDEPAPEPVTHDDGDYFN